MSWAQKRRVIYIGSTLMVFLLFAIAVFSPIFFVSAQTITAIKEVNCWDYYKFYDNSYQITGFQTDKDSFVPGDMIFFSGIFKNNSSLMLPQTKVMTQVWYFDNGVEFMLDESLTDLGMVGAGEEKPIKGAFILPKGAPGGKYLLEAYVLQNNYYLSGTGFLRGSPGARAGFTVTSTNKPIFFRGDKILYDQTLINLHSPITGRIFSVDESAVFRAYLKNDTASNIKTDLKKELFYWDGLADYKIKEFDAESLTVGSKLEKEIKSDLGKLGPGSYVLRLTATSKDIKTILNVRFLVQGAKARIWYSNVLNYPIKKGSNMAIVCIGNMAPTTASPNFVDDSQPLSTSTVKNETVEISVNSLNGIEKAKVSQNFELSQDSIKGYLIDFSSPEELNSFYLTTKVSETDFNKETLLFKSSAAKVLQTTSTVETIQAPSKSLWTLILVLTGILLAILISISIWYKKFQK